MRKKAVEIDYTIAMVLFPPILLGASFGLLAYNYIPYPIVVGLLMVLIMMAASKSLTTGIKRFKKETIDINSEKEAERIKGITLKHTFGISPSS